MKTLYTASCKWRGPADSEKVIYYAGITQDKFTNLKLVDSYDSAYPSKTAFKLVGTSSTDKDRIYSPTSLDTVILFGVDSTVPYGIDDDKNLLIINENYPIQDITTDSNSDGVPNVHVTLVKNYASLFKANSISFDKVLDYQIFGERAITSMVAVSSGIFLAGVSGKVWFYNGHYLKGPIFYMEDGVSLPASSLLVHKFDFETEDYIYVGSDKKPRLYRAKVSTALDGKGWERLYPTGELNASSGGILSLTSAFDKIFIGCRNKKILKYRRTKEVVLLQPTNLITEEVIVSENITETLQTSTLSNPNLEDFQNYNFGIKSLEVGKNQVFAGADVLPHIWSYTEITKNNPSDELWTVRKFDEVFRNDPAPAQFYGYDNKTNSRSDTNLAIARYEDPEYPKKVNQVLVIKGNTRTSTGSTAYGSRLFEFAEGSDWEQLQSHILPDQDFVKVQCASTEAISSFSNISAFDGYTLQDKDLVMIKDQTSSGTNGIFNGIYQFINSDFVRYTPSLDANTNTLGFFIDNGYTNKKNRYLLDTNDIETENYSFYKPKSTVEMECVNLSYTQANQCTVLEECVYLNIDEVRYDTTDFTGYQGIEIANVYGIFSFEINNSNFVMKSGNNLVVKNIPKLGVLKEWMFNNSGVASTQSWQAGNFVSGIASTTQIDQDIYGTAYSKNVLRVTPTQSGDSQIYIDNLDLAVDFDSVISLKLKITPKTVTGDPANEEEAFNVAKISASWAYEGGSFINKSSTILETSSQYVEYTIKPTWKGTISKLQISFDNIPELSRRPSFYYLDYIKIINENVAFDVNTKLSKIRFLIEDRDVKVYLDKQLYPLINVKNFISLDNYNRKYYDPTLTDNDYDKPYIRFGKINNYGGDSIFGYSKISFAVGEAYEPSTKEVYDFSHTHELKSTGGVRLLTYHDGTLYSITDGFDGSNLNDNPDDRQAKLFTYNSDSESWIQSDLPFDRKKSFNSDGSYDLLGIVRPVDAISYKGTLYLSGQYGSIK